MLRSPELSQSPVAKLIFELSKLPGIGEKTATRLAYHILKQDESYSQALAQALLIAKRHMGLCMHCLTFSDQNPCAICANPSRDASVICVVEKSSDALALEQAAAHHGLFRGVYHVLHGLVSPLDGVGPDDLKIAELLKRVTGQTREVIFALNPGIEAEATSLVLSKLLKPHGVKLSRLAYGIPMGGQIEYTDRQTIGKALENRMEIH